jgi:glycosyltransferase involved in cell wall biosynthesis
MNNTALPRSYVVITPARDEERYLRRTLDAMAAQTRLPAQWILVDDGSTDRTGAMMDEFASGHAWCRALHRRDRGRREAGGGVMEAFYDGYALLTVPDWGVLVKLDGDLSFEPDFFERCLAEFAADPALGLGGGLVCAEVGGRLEAEVRDLPPFHVRGATKMYRRECWEAIHPLIRAPGWDTLDELSANRHGWRTRTFPDLKLLQHRGTGVAAGAWRNSVKNGQANYACGYDPVFMFVKCLRRLPRKPWLVDSVGLAWGFLRGYAKRLPRTGDRDLIRYVRGQQWRHLLGRSNLWRP